jgi:dihydrofolate reductase
MSIAIIAALAKNRTIGIDNVLPWRCPEDLKHFKALTLGHHLIMGRKTFDSIGRALPGRTTVVITRNRTLSFAGCQIAHSLPEAIRACTDKADIFIAGGADIYRQSLALADILYLTEIQQDVTGDAHFPELDENIWQEVSREVRIQAIPYPLEYHFVIYQRKARPQ